MQREGICAVGNMIVDLLFEVERYPGLGELSAIRGARGMSAGGLACNIPLDLARLDGSLPIQACGVLGDDAEGDCLRAQFSQFENIDTSRILPGAQTDYTLVINDAVTKERTFFTYCGSSGLLDADSLDLSALPARILHAGYILLLEGLDRADEEHGTQMAKLLRRAQRLGMRTSVDVVSETGDRFTRLVPPALRYTDYCIINELEAQQVVGVPLREPDGRLRAENMREALGCLKALGVGAWAVVHCPEGAYGLDERGEYTALPSLRLSADEIKSTTGAGDAFCAGTLYGAHEGWRLADALRLGTAAAALSLGGHDTYSNILPVAESLRFYKEKGGR